MNVPQSIHHIEQVQFSHSPMATERRHRSKNPAPIMVSQWPNCVSTEMAEEERNVTSRIGTNSTPENGRYYVCIPEEVIQSECRSSFDLREARDCGVCLLYLEL